MTNPVAIESTVFHQDKPAYRRVLVWCPGCDQPHSLTVEVFDGYTGRRDGTPEPVWGWDGDLVSPTFSPSLLCYSSVHLCNHTYWVCPTEVGGECEDRSHLVGYRLPDGTAIAPKVYEPVPDGAIKALVHSSPHDDPAWGNCHSFIRAGQWQFLTDSAHALAGQTVDLAPLPDWIVGRGEAPPDPDSH